MSNINNSEEEEIRILKNIERLQNMEKELYKQLEDNSRINSGDPYLSSVNERGFTFDQAKEFCTKEGVRLCKKSEIMDKNICKSGWIEEKEIGYPMANPTEAQALNCGGPLPGWRSRSTTSNPGAHCCRVDKPTLSAKSIDNVVNRINQISEIRMSLYKSLNYTYQSMQKNVNTSRSELVELLTVVSIVEDELNNAKIQLNQLYEIKHNKMRMVEINTYYGKRYKAQSGVMKLIIFICIILLVLAILRKKGLIPESIANILLGVVIALGGFFIIWRIFDISRRDNMNFDAYKWNFNPDAKLPLGEYKAPEINLPKIDCIGNACCTDGMIYDAKIRKCIKGVAPETFVSGQLTKHCFTNKPEGKKNPMTSPIPYGSNETINFASV